MYMSAEKEVTENFVFWLDIKGHLNAFNMWNNCYKIIWLVLNGFDKSSWTLGLSFLVFMP